MDHVRISGIEPSDQSNNDMYKNRHRFIFALIALCPGRELKTGLIELYIYDLRVCGSIQDLVNQYDIFISRSIGRKKTGRMQNCIK